ncbi:MAG: RiPP maturation radical SAM protein 1 [bacterium]|nr:RiPP maturation radical SAM protein 1 [bacterium]
MKSIDPSKPLKLALICMPTVPLHIPSLGLAQIQSVIRNTFPDDILCDIHHLHHDFARLTGIPFYRVMVDELNSGLGDWFFRQLAFPEEKDNSAEYFKYYFTGEDGPVRSFRSAILEKRELLDDIFDEMIQAHNLLKADIVGFTSLFYQNGASIAMARKLKSMKKNIITLIGGANAGYPMGPELIKNTGSVDFAFSGPALESLPLFLRSFLDGNSEALHSIPGVFSIENIKEKNKYADIHRDEFIYGARSNINLAPGLSYDSFLDSYERNLPGVRTKPFLLYATSEGCYRGENRPCTFCAQAGPCGNAMTFSAMTPDRAQETILSLQQYRERTGLLYAVDSIVPPRYARDVYAHIHSQIPIHLEMDIHFSAEELTVLSRAGVSMTEAGIESLSTESLGLMNKGTTAWRNLEFMIDSTMADIFVVWNLLVGFPGEHEEIYEKLHAHIPLLAHLPPPELVVVGFERFSEYHTNPEKYGLDLRPFEFYRLTWPFGPESVNNLAINFMDHGHAPYRRALGKWFYRLAERCEQWKAAWNNSSRTIPFLYHVREENRRLVIDTRSDESYTVEISDSTFQILEALRTAQSIESLAELFPDYDIQNTMASLVERGFLFRDQDRYFSLVFSEKPQIPSFF